MMELIRNATKTWLAGVVVGLLVISFAMWGVKDIFITNLDDPVAVVGDEEIDAREFGQNYNTAFREARGQQDNSLTQAEALAQGLDQDVLQNMVRRSVVNQVASELGLRASDDLLQRQIITNPAFAGPTGRFEQQSYVETLASAGYSPQRFEAAMRQDLERSQLLGSLVSGMFMPEGLVAALYEYAFEERTMEYFLLPPLSVGEFADPGTGVLEAYYNDHVSAYRASEFRTLTILRLGIADIAATIQVPEEDIATVYEIRNREYRIPERRGIEQLTFSSRQAAEAALFALEQGGSFDAVGGTYIDLGVIARREALDLTVTEAAFAVEEPGLVGIVEGSLSVSIIRVTSIIPESVTPLDEVHDEIRLDLASQAAGEEIFEISEDVQDMQAGGQGLAEIGAQLHLDVTTYDAVDRYGMTPDGEMLVQLLAMDGLLEAAFEIVEGEDSGFRDTAAGDFYIVRLDAIMPTRVKPFSEVRDDVLTAWRDDQVDQALAALGEEATARINGGHDFATVAAEMGRTVRTTPRALRRIDNTEVFSNAVLNSLFTEAAGVAVSGRVQLGASFVVARVTNVQAADVSQASDDIAVLQNTLNEEVAGELISVFVDDAERKLGVRINEQVLTQAVALNN